MKKYFLLILLALMWGPSFLFIKIAVDEITPLFIATVRVTIGALILVSLLLISKNELPRNPQYIVKFFIAGFFAIAFPFFLISWSEQFIESSLAAILNGTVPLFTVVMAHFFTSSDKLSTMKILGLIIGFAGLFVLAFLPINLSVNQDMNGLIGMVVACISYAIGLVYAKRNLTGLNPIVASTGQLTGAAIILWAASLVAPMQIISLPEQLDTIFSLLFLGIFGSALAYILYFQLLTLANPTFLSWVTYLMPIVGVILGAIFLNESLAWNHYVGGSFILFGIFVSNSTLQKKAEGSTKKLKQSLIKIRLALRLDS